MRPLATIWTQSISDPEEARQFEELVRSNQKVLDKLHDILYNMVRESEIRDHDFSSPSWAYQQAHSIGERKALEKIMKIVKLDNS